MKRKEAKEWSYEKKKKQCQKCRKLNFEPRLQCKAFHGIWCTRSLVFFLCFFSWTTFNSLQIFLRIDVKQPWIKNYIVLLILYFFFRFAMEGLCVMFMVFCGDLVFRMTSFQCDLSICTNIWNERFLENPHNSNTYEKNEEKKKSDFAVAVFWLYGIWYTYSYPIGMNDVSLTYSLLTFCGDEMMNDYWMIVSCGGFYANICTLHAIRFIFCHIVHCTCIRVQRWSARNQR